MIENTEFNLNDDLLRMKEEESLKSGCHIKVEDNLVNIYIPVSNCPNTSKVISIPKREVKEVLQMLYME